MDIHKNQITFYGDKGFYGEVNHGVNGAGDVKISYDRSSISFDSWFRFVEFFEFLNQIIAREALDAENPNNPRK